MKIIICKKKCMVNNWEITYIIVLPFTDATTAISGILGWKSLSKIGLDHVLDIANTHLCAKSQKNLMIKSRENSKKPVFIIPYRGKKVGEKWLIVWGSD